MEQTVTIKVKLDFNAQDIATKFEKTMEQYRLACNHISEYMFNHGFDMAQSRLNKALYSDLRTKFGLKSQMAQSAIRNVVAKYKTVKTQLVSKPVYYDTGKKNVKGKEIYQRVYRDLKWLWYPISFNTPQVDLQRNRDWSYLAAKNLLSLNTLDGRVKVTPVCKGFDQYFTNEWKLGIGKLLHIRGKWYLHVSATKEVPDYQIKQTEHVVGIDRGLRFLATCYDEKGRTAFFDGKQVIRKRRKYKRLRARLQVKGTKSAKRRLKKIGQRENRWMTDINHQLSKTLVDKYGKNTLFVIENLAGVREATEESNKDSRYENVSWAFFQLAQFLTYKSSLNSSKTIELPAQYTSQRCPKCGRIRKENRDHHLHLYTCDKCGYRTNDDRLAAINIQQLGTRYVSGEEEPRIIKDK
ncbi:transposase [Lactobacillus sp.]|uniref:transposase n=1 Tax=Lactobacillus sp. TaxID=1591 RepID=UPI00199B3F8F|nr:transposase [Lactobacillus sp.]MBD5430489.1 IS200/IS605 family element transposase accessory protein TnpB [Lactobacillus sp.]MBD5430783.1 IS200/IS605 family element transposase accessory protein TnpB [Lactobacillus sp.]